jgi:glycosyltransferase involved in cell wall biosynthesis
MHRPPRMSLFLNMTMDAVGNEYRARYPHLFDFYIDLASRTGETTLVLPLRRTGAVDAEHGSVPLPANVRVLGLPYWSSGPELVRRAPVVLPVACLRLARHIRHRDLVGAVVPSLVGNLVVTLARVQHRPVFLLIRGEKQRTMRLMLQGKRWARAYVWGLARLEPPVRRWIRSGIPTFVAGEELVERYATPDAHLYALFPGVDRSFPVAPGPRTADDRVTGITTLVTVARLSPEKGIDDLIRAVALLRDRGVAARAIIAGGGPESSQLAALAAELNVQDVVELRGFVPHGASLIELLDEGDVFVLPSHSEGQPHALLEAMTRALPTIGTRVGGIPALLGGGAGILVDPRHPEQIADAVQRLHNDPAAAANLSAQALAVARRYAPEAVLEALWARLCEVYPQLVWSGESGGEPRR